MAKVKLKDIADKAGVSMMTVSRVMNKDPRVSAKTRERISKIVEELQYKPNTAARHLASSRSYCIGIACEFSNASYVNKFLAGSLRKCRTIGYHVVLDELGELNSNPDLRPQDLLDVANIDGIVLLPPISDNKDVIEYLKQENVNFVRIAPNIDLLASKYICMDDYQAAFDITSELINLGRKRIAHIIGSNSQGVSRLRYQGYLDALRSHQIDSKPEYIVQGDFSYKSGFEGASQLLSLSEPPDAIFAANDEMAAATISVAHMKNMRVPENLAIVGFDDTEIATIVWPQLSTVRQPLEEMADLAIELLINSQNNASKQPIQGQDKSNRYVLDYQIKTRESSKIKT